MLVARLYIYKLLILLPLLFLWSAVDAQQKGSTVGKKCEYVFTQKSFYFTSPGYPEFYPNNAVCKWKIVAESGYHIQLTIIDVDIEDSKHCKFDSVTIYDGEGNTAIPVRKLCGTKLPENVQSVGNVLTVTMETDKSENGKGFQMKYTMIPACTYMVRESAGKLESPGYPFGYPDGVYCTYHFPIVVNKFIHVYFEEFELEDMQSYECFDYLSILTSSKDGTETLEGQFCGSSLAKKSLCFDARTLTMKLITDKMWNLSGFKLSYMISDDPCTADENIDNLKDEQGQAVRIEDIQELNQLLERELKEASLLTSLFRLPSTSYDPFAASRRFVSSRKMKQLHAESLTSQIAPSTMLNIQPTTYHVTEGQTSWIITTSMLSTKQHSSINLTTSATIDGDNVLTQLAASMSSCSRPWSESFSVSSVEASQQYASSSQEPSPDLHSTLPTANLMSSNHLVESDLSSIVPSTTKQTKSSIASMVKRKFSKTIGASSKSTKLPPKYTSPNNNINPSFSTQIHNLRLTSINSEAKQILSSSFITKDIESVKTTTVSSANIQNQSDPKQREMTPSSTLTQRQVKPSSLDEAIKVSTIQVEDTKTRNILTTNFRKGETARQSTGSSHDLLSAKQSSPESILPSASTVISSSRSQEEEEEEEEEKKVRASKCSKYLTVELRGGVLPLSKLNIRDQHLIEETMGSILASAYEVAWPHEGVMGHEGLMNYGTLLTVNTSKYLLYIQGKRIHLIQITNDIMEKHEMRKLMKLEAATTISLRDYLKKIPSTIKISLRLC